MSEIPNAPQQKHFLYIEYDNGEIKDVRINGITAIQLLGLISYIEMMTKADLMAAREESQRQLQIATVPKKGIVKP